MRNTRCLAVLWVQVSTSSASSSLERSFPSTHKAMILEFGGSFPRMAAASFWRAASIWAWEGFWGSRSSASSVIWSLQ